MKYMLNLYDNVHDLQNGISNFLDEYSDSTYYNNQNIVVIGDLVFLFHIYNQRNISKYYGYRFDRIWLHAHVFLLPEDRWFLMTRFTEVGMVIEGNIICI